MANFKRYGEYKKTKEEITLLMLLIFAIALSVLESVLPLYFFLPGLKLGLSNIIIIAMYGVYRYRQIFFILLLKVVITTFITGALSVFFFSLSGMLFSFTLTTLAYQLFKNKITIFSLSVISASAHNIGQIIFAIFYLNSESFVYYIPIALIFSAIFGLVNGKLAQPIHKELKKMRQND